MSKVESELPVETKLVRDKVFNQALARGVTKNIAAETIDDMNVYVAALAKKLVKEAGEFEATWSIEELADVEEVVRALATTLASLKDLRRIRKIKARIQGGFKARVLMSWEDDPPE